MQNEENIALTIPSTEVLKLGGGAAGVSATVWELLKRHK